MGAFCLLDYSALRAGIPITPVSNYSITYIRILMQHLLWKKFIVFNFSNDFRYTWLCEKKNLQEKRQKAFHRGHPPKPHPLLPTIFPLLIKKIGFIMLITVTRCVSRFANLLKSLIPICLLLISRLQVRFLHGSPMFFWNEFRFEAVGKIGRGEPIWTADLLLPRQAR